MLKGRPPHPYPPPHGPEGQPEASGPSQPPVPYQPAEASQSSPGENEDKGKVGKPLFT